MTPILFDNEEEEESLPANLRNSILDDPLIPAGQTEDHTIDQLNEDAPEGPQRSNRQGRGVNEPAQLQKAIQEVRTSAQKKQEEREEKRKKLADIREEEKRNELSRVEEQARQHLDNLENPSMMPKITDQVHPLDKL